MSEIQLPKERKQRKKRSKADALPNTRLKKELANPRDGVDELNDYVLDSFQRIQWHNSKSQKEKYDAEILYDRFVNYVKDASAHNMPLGTQNMLLALRITSQFYNRMLNEPQYYRLYPEVHEVLTAIQMTLSASLELYTATGTIQPVIGIWWQKQYNGFRDQVDIVRHEVSDLDLKHMSKDELKQKYAEISDRLHNEHPEMVIEEADFKTAVQIEKRKQTPDTRRNRSAQNKYKAQQQAILEAEMREKEEKENG